MAEGYTQMYGIDYEKTFVPIAKMVIVWNLLTHYPL